MKLALRNKSGFGNWVAVFDRGSNRAAHPVDVSTFAVFGRVSNSRTPGSGALILRLYGAGATSMIDIDLEAEDAQRIVRQMETELARGRRTK